MSNWNKFGPMSTFCNQILLAKERHEEEFGTNHGLDRIFHMKADLDTVEDILGTLGMDIELPNPGTIDDFEILYQAAIETSAGKVIPIPSAVLVAHTNANVYWKDEDGIRRIKSGIVDMHPIVMIGITNVAIETFCSKLLSAVQLVPFKHGENLKEDLDHDGLYWIDFTDDGYVVRDA